MPWAQPELSSRLGCCFKKSSSRLTGTCSVSSTCTAVSALSAVHLPVCVLVAHPEGQQPKHSARYCISDSSNGSFCGSRVFISPKSQHAGSDEVSTVATDVRPNGCLPDMAQAAPLRETRLDEQNRNTAKIKRGFCPRSAAECLGRCKEAEHATVVYRTERKKNAHQANLKVWSPMSIHFVARPLLHMTIAAEPRGDRLRKVPPGVSDLG